MSAQLQPWMPVFLGLISTLIAIVFTAWLNTRAMFAYVDALRSETKQGFAEQRLEFHKELSQMRSELQQGISGMRLELQQGLSEMRSEFHKVDLRLGHIDQSVDRLDERIQRLEESRGLVRP